jgi:hypothetical protein
MNGTINFNQCRNIAILFLLQILNLFVREM